MSLPVSTSTLVLYDDESCSVVDGDWRRPEAGQRNETLDLTEAGQGARVDDSGRDIAQRVCSDLERLQRSQRHRDGLAGHTPTRERRSITLAVGLGCEIFRDQVQPDSGIENELRLNAADLDGKHQAVRAVIEPNSGGHGVMLPPASVRQKPSRAPRTVTLPPRITGATAIWDRRSFHNSKSRAT